MLMPVPVKVEVRKRVMLPIVEVKAEAPVNFDTNLWINYPLGFINKGEALGGRLISEEPREKMKPNTVFFTMIFETEEKSMDYCKSFQQG